MPCTAARGSSGIHAATDSFRESSGPGQDRSVHRHGRRRIRDARRAAEGADDSRGSGVSRPEETGGGFRVARRVVCFEELRARSARAAGQRDAGDEGRHVPTARRSPARGPASTARQRLLHVARAPRGRVDQSVVRADRGRRTAVGHRPGPGVETAAQHGARVTPQEANTVLGDNSPRSNSHTDPRRNRCPNDLSTWH